MDVLLLYVLPAVICGTTFYVVFKGVTMRIGVLAMAIFLILTPLINIILAFTALIAGLSCLKIWSKEIKL
jgi:hypothetical protein|nr:MAG TPA: hypothetical protein [Caudoviricetes sp.]